MESLSMRLLPMCLFFVLTYAESTDDSISCFISAPLASNFKRFCPDDASSRIYTGNFNKDERTDLLCHNKAHKTIEILFMVDNLIQKQGMTLCSSPASQLYVADFNGDGRDDLLCREPGEKLKFVYADKEGRFDVAKLWKGSKYFCKDSTSTLHLGDINNDGFSDMVCRLNSGGIAISLANRKGHFRSYSQNDMDWCVGKHSVLMLGDFNYDNKLDMLCHNSISGHKSIILASDTQGILEPVKLNYDMKWCNGKNHSFITVGDINGDGYDDLICKDESDFGRTYFAPNNKNGTYFTKGNKYFHFCLKSGKKNFFVGDFNGDGSDDLLCQSKKGTRQTNLSLCSTAHLE